MATLGGRRDGGRLAGGVCAVANRGVFGFSEIGWDPSPHAAISVGAEVLTVLLWAGPFMWRPRSHRESATTDGSNREMRG